MRTLTWYVPQVHPGANQKETYRLDGDYVPVRAWVYLDGPPKGSTPLIVDINADGESIFTLRPILQRDQNQIEEDHFTSVLFSRDTLVTMDVDQVSGGESGGMTVGLELQEA